MFNLHSSLLFLTLVATAYSQAASFNPNQICANIPDNTKIKDPSACNKYITCVNKKPISSTCEGNLFYDRNKRSCVPPNTTKCVSSDPCATQQNVNDFVADPYTCNNYYYCENGKGSLGTCPAGMNFNPSAKTCVLNYNCNIPKSPEDNCNIVPDGVFMKVPNACQSYKLCWLGELREGNCPTGYNFNAFLGACDSSANFDCNDNPKPNPPAPGNDKCTQSGVFLSDGTSCDGYYYCEGQQDGSIKPVYGVCTFSNFFDAKTGACVKRSSVSCKYNRCVGLGYYGIQLANIDGDGCTGYLVCQNGKSISQNQCPNGQYFNEYEQMCIPNPVSFPSCVRANNIM